MHSYREVWDVSKRKFRPAVCVCVFMPIHDSCAFVQSLPVSQDIWEGGKGSVSEGSGLAAGYSRDTLNSRFLRLTGAAQYACM